MTIPTKKVNALMDACNEHTRVLDDLIAQEVKSADYVRKQFVENTDSLFKNLPKKSKKEVWRKLLQLLPNARDLDGVGFSMDEHPAYLNSRLKILNLSQDIMKLIDPNK